jgi:hypothetical protein
MKKLICKRDINKEVQMSLKPRLAMPVVFALVLALFAPRLSAQQTFKTTIYFDFSSPLTTDGAKTASLFSQFNFRRAYFTYENKLNDDLKFRFRYDADNTANITSVNFAKSSTSKDDKLRPFIKHLYLEYSNLLPNSVIRVGMEETITFKLAEDRWGYRSVAKTLTDGYKDITGVDIDATSADLGVSLTGSLSKYFRYGFQVVNGAAYSHAENDKYKKLMFQAQLVPLAGFSLVGYLDYEKQTDTQKALTYKIDSYFEMVRNLTVGFEWFSYRNDRNTVAATGERYDVGGWSLFGRYIVNPDKLSLFARCDHYEPNTKVAGDQINLVIAGFDWAPFSTTFRLQPNIWLYNYEDSAKKNDVFLALTVFMEF